MSNEKKLPILKLVEVTTDEQEFLEEGEYEKVSSDLSVELKKIAEKEDGLHMVNEIYDGYHHTTLWKLESVMDKKPLTSLDSGLHVLVQRFFKKAYLEKGENKLPITSWSKEEWPANLEYLIDELNRDTESALTFFFKEGETYGFNHDDGIISEETLIVEKEDYYDVYAYFAYYGK